MGKKKILILGAAPFQVPAIRYARKRGYLTISCDNNPGNPGHALADKSYQVSTINKEMVLSIATKERINGILISLPTQNL